MPQDLEFRLLRYFVAVAEDLHFGRAAGRLYIAQHVLSREIRRLEERVGRPLLERTTRHVALSPAGETLLPRARELLARHDDTLRELRGEPRGLLVDVVGPGLTPARILTRARAIGSGTAAETSSGTSSDIEFFARFHTGAESAVPLVQAGRLDVTFGRWDGTPDTGGVRERIVRYERFAVLVPEHHPLARHAQIPLEALRGQRLCIRAGDQATPGWERAALQLLAPFQPDPADAHPHVRGGDELAQHVRRRDAPILTLATQPPVAGAVIRPLVDPVAVYPWHMLWRCLNRKRPGRGRCRSGRRAKELLLLPEMYGVGYLVLGSAVSRLGDHSVQRGRHRAVKDWCSASRSRRTNSAARRSHRRAAEGAGAMEPPRFECHRTSVRYDDTRTFVEREPA